MYTSCGTHLHMSVDYTQREWYATVDSACLQVRRPLQRTIEPPEGLVLDTLGKAPGDQV